MTSSAPGPEPQDHVPPRPSGQAAPDGLPVISPTDGIVHGGRAVPVSAQGQVAGRSANLPASPSGGLPAAQPTHLVAVFGDATRAGRWAVPTSLRGVAAFGDVSLDLREADLPEGDVTIDVLSFFGDVRIIVPHGMRVETDGFTVFGDTKVEITDRGEGPTVRVRRNGAFGDLKVKAFEVGEMPPKRWRWL